MKKYLWLSLISIISLAACGEREGGGGTKEAAGAAGVKWLRSLDEGLETAKEQGKPLMVDFYSDRCRWCTVLDRETYADPKVRALAAEFVAVKVDAGKDRRAARTYRIRGLPTIIFMDAGGKAVHTVVGFKPAGPFLADMKTALGKVKKQ